jgi:FkbM family methyltransferase
LAALKSAITSFPWLHAKLLALRWRWRGPKERDLKFLRQLHFDTVLDVGLNVGEYSYFLSPAARRIHGFEPNAKCVRVASRLGLNNLTIHEFGLSRTSGEIVLNIPVENGRENWSLASMRNGALPQNRVTSQKVRIEALDEMELARDPAIDLVKIDVEGAELDTLNGMRTFIKTHDPLFCVEIEKHHNPDWRGCFDLFASNGYRSYATFDGSTLEPVSADVIDDQDRPGARVRRHLMNFFFMRDTRAALLSDYITGAPVVVV